MHCEHSEHKHTVHFDVVTNKLIKVFRSVNYGVRNFVEFLFEVSPIKVGVSKRQTTCNKSELQLTIFYVLVTFPKNSCLMRDFSGIDEIIQFTKLIIETIAMKLYQIQSRTNICAIIFLLSVKFVKGSWIFNTKIRE